MPVRKSQIRKFFMIEPKPANRKSAISYVCQSANHTAKNLYRKFETNITRKGIVRPQSQFPHSCVCERFISSHDKTANSAAGNLWTDPRNIQIAHRHVNVKIGTEAAQFPGMEYCTYKWDFPCSAQILNFAL
jgi:hypothetical protein